MAHMESDIICLDDDEDDDNECEPDVCVENEGLLKTRLILAEKKISDTKKKIQELHDQLETWQQERDKIKSLLQEKNSEKLLQIDWKRTDHKWSKELELILNNTFKINKLRSHQLPTINAALSGQDVILIMPTGGGKSLCFQLSALLLPGVTLVISPLVSLMEDQLLALRSLGISASMFSASLSKSSVTSLLNEMTDPRSEMKILYVSPEKVAKSKRFMAKLEKMNAMGRFSLLAIDEVHCCSQWGHDFRPDYKFLGIMRRQYPKVPIMGLTATSTARVTADVQKMLNIQGCLVLKASFNRPNLMYKVLPKNSNSSEAMDELASIITGKFKGKSGIVYCLSIRDSEEICKELCSRGVKSGVYHASLDTKDRSATHYSWTTNGIQVIVATVAFGMGIDKPDVRFVIHHSISKSMENFYQESGRAGRDGQPAECILFFRLADVFRQSPMAYPEQTGLENLYAMVSYCTNKNRCRRAIIADHFGERWDSSHCNKMCDNCYSIDEGVIESTDVSKSCQAVFSILEHADVSNDRLTAQKLLDAWMGKGPAKLRVPKAITSSPRETCELIIALMLIDGCLKEDFHFTPYTTISYIILGEKAKAVKEGRVKVFFDLPSKKRKPENYQGNTPKRTAQSGGSSEKKSTKTCVVSTVKSRFGGEKFQKTEECKNDKPHSSDSPTDNSKQANKQSYSRIRINDNSSDDDMDFTDWDKLGKKAK